MEDNIVINSKLLIKTEISLLQYYILECIFKSKEKILVDYVDTYGSIDISVFNDLIKKGYIESVDVPIKFDDLKLTPKFYKQFNYEKLDYNKLFDEFRDIYPKKVGRRRLHQNLSDCRKKYKDIIDSIETHNTILKCVQLYVQDLESTNRMEYIQLMVTWINQKNYEQYYEEARNLEEVKKQDNSYNII